MDDKLRILLVEDDPATRATLRILLSQAASHASVVEATSGEDALAALAGDPIDIIVADHHLGGLDGIALLATARDAHPRVGRVLLTGHADFELAREAINRGGVHAFLQKPVTLPVIVRALASAQERVANELSFRP